MHRYRLRRTVAAGSCATAPLVVFLPCLLLLGGMGSSWLGAVVGLVAAAVVFTLTTGECVVGP